MARPNRIVVEDGVYHLTSRVAHRAFLLAPPEVKDKIVTWMYGIADFCGIDLYAWNILDNHFHIECSVPSVPERYWLSAPSGTDPETPSTDPACPLAAAFSMRPVERRSPRWQPDLADLEAARLSGKPIVITPAGDRPSREAVRIAIADAVPVVTAPRPGTGFTMSDDEMVSRLERLYDGHSNAARYYARRWRILREEGRDEEVEREKESFCRRMYNVSQFMKLFKQRISEHFNRRLGHAGHLWEGRFYSGLVERESRALLFTTAYIDWNGPKTGRVRRPQDWKWSSYATACGDGLLAARARRGYEAALGCPWEEARARLEAIFAQKLPESYDPTKDRLHYTVTDRDGNVRKVMLTLAQFVKAEAKHLFRGGFFAKSVRFADEVYAKLPKRFPGARKGVLKILAVCDWSEPPRLAA